MKYCIICKQEYIPGIKKSFFKFPKEGTTNRTKWLLVVGKERVSKHTSVCSDHFDASSFHENIYARQKRLKPDAVPCLKLSSSISIEPSENRVHYVTNSFSTSDTNFDINGTSRLDRTTIPDFGKVTVKEEDLQISNCYSNNGSSLNKFVSVVLNSADSLKIPYANLNGGSNLERAATIVLENPTIKAEDLQISDSDDIYDCSSLDNILHRTAGHDWAKKSIKSEVLQISDSDCYVTGSISDRSETEDTEKSKGYYENETLTQDLGLNHQRKEKRKVCMHDESDNSPFIIPYKKKLYYKNGNETRWIDGNDILFKTQRSYENFEDCLAYLKRQAEYHRKRYCRSVQKIHSLKQVIKELKGAKSST